LSFSLSCCVIEDDLVDDSVAEATEGLGVSGDS
jgi:hypothetical protein